MNLRTTLTIIEKVTTHYTNNNWKRNNTLHQQYLEKKQHTSLTMITKKQHTTLTILGRDTTCFTNNDGKRNNTLHSQLLEKKQHTTLTIIEKETTHCTENN